MTANFNRATAIIKKKTLPYPSCNRLHSPPPGKTPWFVLNDCRNDEYLSASKLIFNLLLFPHFRSLRRLLFYSTRHVLQFKAGSDTEIARVQAGSRAVQVGKPKSGQVLRRAEPGRALWQP